MQREEGGAALDERTKKRPREEPVPRPAGLDERLELRTSPISGNGIFARERLDVGVCWSDHPVCVPCKDGGARQLPHMDTIDDLMEEIVHRCQAGDPRFTQLRPPSQFRLSHVARHLEMQGDGPEEGLPDWALATGTLVAEYNLLAAQLQSNIARHADGEGLVLNPLIRLANHSCNGNTDLAWVPPDEASPPPAAGACPCAQPCGVGHYVLRARRAIGGGEEIAYSYLGSHVLLEQAEMEERRATLLRRWGFDCQCALCVKQLQVASDTSVF